MNTIHKFALAGALGLGVLGFMGSAHACERVVLAHWEVIEEEQEVPVQTWVAPVYDQQLVGYDVYGNPRYRTVIVISGHFETVMQPRRVSKRVFIPTHCED